MKRTKEQSKNPSSLFQDDNKLYSRIYKVFFFENFIQAKKINSNNEFIDIRNGNNHRC